MKSGVPWILPNENSELGIIKINIQIDNEIGSSFPGMAGINHTGMQSPRDLQISRRLYFFLTLNPWEKR